MKVIKKLIITLLLLILFIPINIKASTKPVNVYMFYGDGCPHCEEALEYLNSVKGKYNLNIYRYEAWYNDENQAIMHEVADLLDVNVSGVPFTIVNDKAIFGYSKGVTDETFRYNINQASKHSFADKVGVKLGVAEEIQKENNNKTDDLSYQIQISFAGTVNLEKLSLPATSILLGIIDGLNPCSILGLVFLIITLIGVKDKKRIWTLAITFLASSSLVYLAFMTSWFQFEKIVNMVVIVRLIIAIIAIIGGAICLNAFANQIGKDGQDNIAESKKKENVFSKNKFIFSIIGVIFIAGAINLIELACSTGLPNIYTQILDVNNLSAIQYFIYMIMYIFFFMLVDLIIFIIAFKVLQIFNIKHSKYSNLINGIIMFIIGVLLLVRPEWLMFKF